MLTASDNRVLNVEPGLDPRHIAAEAIHPCKIEIKDYSAIRNTHQVIEKIMYKHRLMISGIIQLLLDHAIEKEDPPIQNCSCR